MTTLRPSLFGTPTGRNDDASFGIAFDNISTEDLLPIARLLSARENERRHARRIRRLRHLRIHACIAPSTIGMLDLPMRPPGTFKLLGNARHNASDAMDPLTLCGDRSDRIVNSLRMQILEGDTEQSLRIRQIFDNPKEIYRVEIQRPDQGYQRTTLLDREALEDLLATDDIRSRVIDLVD